MRRLLRIGALGIATLTVATGSFGLGWYFGRTDQMLSSALVDASGDLSVLHSLHRGQVTETIDLLELELDANTSVAAIAISDFWLSSRDRAFAECVLAKVKKHREAHPSRSTDPEFAALLTELLAQEFECPRAAA